MTRSATARARAAMSVGRCGARPAAGAPRPAAAGPRERRPAGRPALAVLAAALAPGLLACSAGPGGGASSSPCPGVAIVRGADTVTVYRADAERTAANVRYVAALADLASACRYEDGRVAVDLRLTLVAEKGPAYAGGAPRLTYLVAVVGPGDELLARETFATEIAVPEGAPRAGAVDELTQFIPGVTPDNVAAYRVLLAFALSEEEVRRRRQGVGGGLPLGPGRS